jgi:hypothetical protein
MLRRTKHSKNEAVVPEEEENRTQKILILSLLSDELSCKYITEDL